MDLVRHRPEYWCRPFGKSDPRSTRATVCCFVLVQLTAWDWLIATAGRPPLVPGPPPPRLMGGGTSNSRGRVVLSGIGVRSVDSGRACAMLPHPPSHSISELNACCVMHDRCAPFAAGLVALPNSAGSSGGALGASLVSRSGRLLAAKYPEPVTVHVDTALTPRSPRVVHRCVANVCSCFAPGHAHLLLSTTSQTVGKSFGTRHHRG